MKLQITIDGKAYAVDVEVLEEVESLEMPQYVQHQAGHSGIDHPQAHAGGAWDADGRIYRSPVMGLAVKVNVTPGQQVDAGELLLVLEAMKMETHVTAPHAGAVKSVPVSQGDPVKIDQILVEFE